MIIQKFDGHEFTDIELIVVSWLNDLGVLQLLVEITQAAF